MINTLSVTLAPWAVSRIVRDYGKPNSTGVTIGMLTRSLAEFPDTEFRDVWGRTLTIREVRDSHTGLEVRKPNGSLLCMVSWEPNDPDAVRVNGKRVGTPS